MNRRADIVTTGLLILGLALLSSSLLKGLSPEPAVSWLASVGIGVRTSIILTTAIAVLEASVGASLVLLPEWRPGRIVALIYFLAIVIVRLGARLAGASGDCGCFGDIAIPKTIIWIFLVVGLIFTALSLRPFPLHRRTQARGGRIATSIILVGLVSIPLVRQIFSTVRTTPWEDRVASSVEEPLIIIGSTDCPHCRSLLRKVPVEKLKSLAFLVREDDRGKLMGPYPKLHRISSEVWWSALENAPPALFERHDQASLVRLTEMELLERLRR